MRSREYANLYHGIKLAGGEVILDNGAAEHSRLSLTELVGMTNQMHPSCVVVPDEPNDTDKTLDLFRTSFHALLSYCPIMMVPQGHDIDSWTRCLLYMTGQQAVWRGSAQHYIGVSKFTHLWNSGSRLELLGVLEHYNFHRQFKVHLLGVNNPLELLEINQHYPWVYGVDTSLPVAMGLKNFELSDYDDVGKIEMDFSSPRPSKEQGDLIALNIRDLRALCGLPVEEEYQQFLPSMDPQALNVPQDKPRLALRKETNE